MQERGDASEAILTAQVSLFDAWGTPAPRVEPERPSLAALRPYQTAAVESALAKLSESPSTLIVMPTGTGKTRTASEIVRRWSGPVTWIAHREELIEQGRRDLQKYTGELVGKEKAEEHAHGGRVVVASVQTLKGERLESFARRHTPSLIVVDEAHHAVAPSYKAILERFKDAKVLGLTATPDRADEKAMGQVFETVAYVYEIHDAIRDGYLCSIRISRVLVDAIDLSAVRTVAGDLNQGDLDAVMSAEKVLHGVVKPTMELAGDRRTIVFTTSVANAHRMAEIFNRYRAGCARAVDGGTDPDLRRTTLRDHSNGQYQFLCNVGVLTEGYDDPAVSCIAMARPTKSRALYAQCAGRGLRIFPGKADCLLLDFVGNSGRHALVSGLDILAGKYDDEAVERARKIVDREGQEVTAEEALERAAKELEEQRAREAARRAAVKAKSVSYQVATADPFAILHVKDPGKDPWAERYGHEATLVQLEHLKKAGIDVPVGITKAQASKLLDSVFTRRRMGLATFKQLKTLQKYGVNSINLKFARASAIIDAIASNGWRPLPGERLTALMGRTPGEEG